MDISVCFSSDRRYARHLAVAMVSVLRNKARGDRLTFFVLDGGIDDTDKDILHTMARQYGSHLHFIPVDEGRFRHAPLQTMAGSVSHVSRAAYFRLLLASLLPHTDKVIYLDCDLICRTSLAPLYAEELNRDWIRGVEDIDADRHCLRLGLKRYVCSGVLLMDLRAWREHGVERLCMDYLRTHADSIILHDQDVLNVVCQDHLGLLDRTWDAQACSTKKGYSSGFNALAERSAIVHFIGGRKPWQAGCTHPFRREYFRYLRLTPYRHTIWRWRWEKLCYALAHTRYSHGRRRWYLLGVRVWQKKDA